MITIFWWVWVRMPLVRIGPGLSAGAGVEQDRRWLPADAGEL
jgi:hypothetical protein